MANDRIMIDADGREVPAKYVGKYDKARDAAARRIAARFRKARADMEKLVAESLGDIERLRMAGGSLGGQKGNIQFASFDGNIQVSIRQSYLIRLDERVIAAREKLLAYLSRITAKVEGQDGAALRAIVESAFRADSQGMLSASRIVGLLRLKINAPEWVEAVNILRDCLNSERGKQYLRCSVRPSRQKEFKMIRLEVPDCWPEE